MADCGYPRKHGRLESLLQKSLAEEASRITWYEPCIIDGGPAKKPSYSFVVLTDENMYLIDNPPKQLRAIVALCEIVNIEVLHEGPIFLKGKERKNAQSIKIYCKLDMNVSPVNSLLHPVSRLSAVPSRAISLSSGGNSESSLASLNSTPDKKADKKLRRFKKFFMSLLWPKRKTAVIHHFRQAAIPRRDVSVDNEHFPLTKLLPLTQLVDNPSNGALFSVVSSAPQSVASSVSDGMTLEWLCKVGKSDPEMSYPGGGAADTNSLASNGNSTISDVTVHSDLRSRTALGNYADHWATPSSAILRSLSDAPDTESSSLSESVQSIPNEEEELNLYILKPLSGFFKHLKVAWTNCLVKQTLCLEERSEPHTIRNDSEEHIEHLFHELHRKLHMNSDNNFVIIRQLSDEIRRTMVTSSLAKKNFWKDPHIFPAMVKKLRVLVSSSNKAEHHTIGYTMDKIKACSSLIHILACVLQESFLCVGRLKHLAYKSGQRTKDLLTILVAMPWIPQPYREHTMLTVTSYDLYSSKEWENLMEASLIRSIAELTNFSTMALYQYFQLALGSHEMMSYHYANGIGWMTRVMSEVNSFETFVSRLMCQLLLLTNANDQCPLRPAQAVLLHQQLSVLSTFVSSSPNLALQIAITFGDDIRYFVHRQIVEKKVLPDYPIRSSLLQSVDTLRETIFRKQASVAPATQFIRVNH